jgi:hypothetical protein
MPLARLLPRFYLRTVGIAVAFCCIAFSFVARVNFLESQAARRTIDHGGVVIGYRPVLFGIVRYVDGIDLLKADVSDDDVSVISRSQSLRYLLLRGRGISDRSMALVSTHLSLSNLALEESSVTERGAGELETLHNLQSLSLRGSDNIPDASIARIVHQNPSLIDIDLRGTRGGAATIESISKLRSLTHLWIWKGADVDDLRDRIKREGGSEVVISVQE